MVFNNDIILCQASHKSKSFLQFNNRVNTTLLQFYRDETEKKINDSLRLQHFLTQNSRC